MWLPIVENKFPPLNNFKELITVVWIFRLKGRIASKKDVGAEAREVVKAGQGHIQKIIIERDVT